VIVCTRSTGRPLDRANSVAYHSMVNDAVASGAPDQAARIIGQTLKLARDIKLRVSMSYAGEPLT
jgi:hypothetical protein